MDDEYSFIVNPDKCRAKLKDIKSPSKSLVIRRASLKRCITVLSNKLAAEASLTPELLHTSIATIKTKLFDIADLDSGILEIYESHDVFFTLDTDVFNSEVDSQAAYVYKVNEILAELRKKLNDVTTEPSGGQGPGLPGGGSSNLGQFRAPKLQQIHITPFSGDKDVLEFSDFLKSFNDLVGDKSNLTKSSKLIYLKSFLSSGALDC